MEKILLLPAFAILSTYVVFGAPGSGYNTIDFDEGGESQCLSSVQEPGYCGNGEDDGSEVPVDVPARIFEIPDGWKPPSNEPCPDPILVKQNFNVPRYMGLWYEIERMWNPFSYRFSTGGCITAKYTLKEDGNVEVINSNGFEPGNPGTPGTGVPSDGGEGSLTITVPGSAGAAAGVPQPTGPNYNILLTDYESYAVVYFCDTLKIPQSPQKIKLEYSWILSRTYNMSEYRVEEIKDNLKRFLKIDTERFNPTNQENCPRLQLD